MPRFIFACLYLFVIFKTGRLLNINFFIDVAIEKCTLDIYLIELDVVGISIGKQDSNCFQSCNRGVDEIWSAVYLGVCPR